jgi:hypothetical protein
MDTAIATRGTPAPAVGRASRLARACSAEACLATHLAGHLLGEETIDDLAELIHVVFPAPGEREELARRAARHRAEGPAPGDEAARVRAFIDLLGETRFPIDDFALWEAGEATHDALLAGIPFARHGWCYDDLHDAPGSHRPGFALLRALAADPDDGVGIAGRGALLDHLGARGIPHHLLAPLADWGLSAATLETRLAGTRFAAAADFARWIAQDTGLAFLDYADDDGLGEAPWSRRHVAILAEQWPRARALLDAVEALAAWLESDPPAHFAQLLGAAGLVPPAPTRGGAP